MRRQGKTEAMKRMLAQAVEGEMQKMKAGDSITIMHCSGTSAKDCPTVKITKNNDQLQTIKEIEHHD